jgi:hypothetical protein
MFALLVLLLILLFILLLLFIFVLLLLLVLECVCECDVAILTWGGLGTFFLSASFRSLSFWFFIKATRSTRVIPSFSGPCVPYVSRGSVPVSEEPEPVPDPDPDPGPINTEIADALSLSVWLCCVVI